MSTPTPDWQSLTVAAREAVETARAALDEFARAWEHATGPQASDEKETVTSDDVIEQAAIALAEADGQSRHDVVWDFDDEGRKTVSEPAWVYYVPSGQALADAGLLARPLPDREQIAAAILEAELWHRPPGIGGQVVPAVGDRHLAVADAVLALLKGRDG